MMENNDTNIILTDCLSPLKIYLEQQEVMEINVVEPFYLLLETKSDYQRIHDEKLTYIYWENLCLMLSHFHHIEVHQDFSRISCILPGGHRFEAVWGACVNNQLSISIRCFRDQTLTCFDFNMRDSQIEFLEKFLNKGLNLIITGGTSTGKTKFLNILLKLLKPKTRILSLEDAHEITLGDNYNYSAQYLMSGHDVSHHQATIVNHFLRSRPDYIVLGEVTVNTTLLMIRLLNSGHAGFITTLHAHDPMMVADSLKSNTIMLGIENFDINPVMQQCIDCIIHLNKNHSQKYVDKFYIVRESRYI